MNKELATKIVDTCVSSGEFFDVLAALIGQIEDQDEQKFLRRQLGQAIAIVGYDLVMHCVKQFPELDPDK